LLAVSGLFCQSPNHALNLGVRTNRYCSGVRLDGFPLGASNIFPSGKRTSTDFEYKEGGIYF
jgi:hypothetical protein